MTKPRGERDVWWWRQQQKRDAVQGQKLATVRVLSSARCCTASLQNKCARGMHKLLPTNNDPNSRHPHMINTHCYRPSGLPMCYMRTQAVLSQENVAHSKHMTHA